LDEVQIKGSFKWGEEAIVVLGFGM